MQAVRLMLSTFLFGATIAPLGPHALLHAWSDAHFHRHADGVAHSHHHDADHHEHEIDSDPSGEARLLPSRETHRSGGEPVAHLTAAPAVAPPPSASRPSWFDRPGAPPGRRAFSRLGRSTPA